MIPLTPPTIHMNGTSKEELVKQLMAAVDAARLLGEALNKAAPNARDYYPQGDDAYRLARAAWTERQLAVDTLMNDLLEQAMRITLA